MKKFSIRICSRCKSGDLGMPLLGSSKAVPGSSELSGFWECRKCGFVGAPIIVEKTLGQKTSKKSKAN